MRVSGESDFFLVNALGDGAKGKGEPALVAREKLGEADVVGD